MRWLLLPLLLLSASCSAIRYDADWDQAFDFSGLHTWAFLAKEPGPSGDPRLDNDLFHERTRDAIRRTLQARGFEGPVATDPQFLVTWQTSVEQRVDVDYVQRHYGYANYHWGGWTSVDQEVRVRDVGNLLIDVLVPGEKRLVWRGTASADLVHSATPEERVARISEAVQGILANFPPPKE
ncbi:MAG: DUF4136 domain-containing protein [Planctomycetota bacterium]